MILSSEVSPPTTFIDIAPLCVVLKPVLVSSPLASVSTVASLDEGEDDDVSEEVVVGTDGLTDVLDVDDSGRVHVAKSVLLGDEHDVFVSGVFHAILALVKVALTFDAIEE
ncbi:hypothetical protein V6N11_067814 [Hibiscus sabdariffa]|uniref:Uncharacterized protein n=1 Tax=Hibiscus sabdariffa TaxID=183260 RepID=A0ABR2SSU4_9ROSI